MERVLVTGAAGFLGSWIAEDLASLGTHRVVGVDIAPLTRYPRGKAPFQFIRLDLHDERRTAALIRRVRPDILLHLAANAREGASWFHPRSSTRNNLCAYLSVLEPSIACGVRKVVLFSSMAVYGDQKPPFEESMPRRPVDPYGVNKAAMEHITETLSLAFGFRYTILRPHNVFGEGQSLRDPFRNVIAIFANAILRGEPVCIHGDGEQKRAFSYILNSLPCYRKVVLEDWHGRIFNIGGGQEISINEVARLVLRAMKKAGVTIRSKIVHTEGRPYEVKEAWCTTALSERLLGYRDAIPLDRAIERFCAWAVRQGPQPWIRERLPLQLANMPSPWRAHPTA